MNNRKFKFGLAAAAVMNLGVASQALAAGFEKSIPWGGRTAGVAGIGTPYIQGSQALFFNPAGLVSDKVGQDVSLNISPTWSKFSGPFNTVQGGVKQFDGKQTVLTPFGLIYGATLNENLGFGIGGYISGGANAVFEELDFSPRAIRPNVRTKIQIYELAAGLGYRVTPELKLGAAWRVAFVNANFGAHSYITIPGPATAIVNLESTDLKDTQFTGFKLGAQYKLGENTLLGASFRSEINFEAEGDVSGKLDSGTVSDVPKASLKASSTLPMAITLGAQHDIVPNEWRILGEYVFTQYSRVDRIDLQGSITTPLGAREITDFETKWKDQHNIRVAGEYLGFNAWPVRLGYVWTNTVTDAAYARPTFTPPGPAHTITLGTGTMFNVGASPVQLDVAGEYTTTKGDGDSGSSQAQLSPTGTYEVNAYALHAGVTVAF